MSSVGGGQARARFSLEDEEDLVEAAVASASVAFSGLTILPPQQPSASGSWVGVGGGLVPGSVAPASRALRSRGGVSVSSGLTDLASLSLSAPFLGGGGVRGVGVLGGLVGGGEGGSWRPSTDPNNIGKSRSIHLVLLKNTSSKICFGCIGTDERRFCRSPQCTTKAHKKTRFDMGCDAGYFIATRRSSSLIAAFRAPFLDAAKLTEEVRAIVEDQGPDGERTTRQWEEFMVEAKVAWRVLEEERRQAGGIIREGSDEDEVTLDLAIDLPDTPSVYEWEDAMSIQEVTFKTDETESEELPAITELREVIQDLSRKLKLMARSSRLDALGSMDHLWKSIARLGEALESSNKSVRDVRDELGDVSELQLEHNVYDVTEGVTLALTGRPWADELSALGDRVSDVGKLLSEVDEDHQATGRLLLRKITSLSSPAVTPSLGTVPPLITSMVICDEQGNPCCTLGDLLRDHRSLRAEHSTLKADFESLSAAVTAQGGQVLDGLGFASEAMVRILVMKECPKGDAFEVFLDVTSLFCCDSTYSPVSGWEKSTRGMEDDFSPSARKVVASYAQSHCAWYTDGKPVVAGKLLAAFKDADRWNGVGGMDGRRNEIETSAATSAEIARGYISDKLPKAGKLAPLALKMVDRTVEWVHTVHKHLDMELTRLTQLHISEEESLILLSEEVIIMYSRIHDVRKHMMEFTGQVNKVDYMVRCIWVTLQVHRVMQEFVQGGLKSHPAIGSAFIRFLTKQTGNNVASGVGVQLGKLTTAVERIETLAKTADTAAKDAARVSKEANTRAATANSTAEKASEGLKTLFTKNTTLKR